jgi:hypothetical protein
MKAVVKLLNHTVSILSESKGMCSKYGRVAPQRPAERGGISRCRCAPRPWGWTWETALN